MSLHSNYWLNEYDLDLNNDIINESNDNDLVEIINLSNTRRAISNYVNILTNKSIPVVFKGDTSFTNGEYINISANINKKNHFDAMVGLSLHESSHIVYTDFN